MHVGVKNRNFEYEMDGAWLQKVEQKKDLGVIINNDLKPTKHCIEVCKKASQRSRVGIYPWVPKKPNPKNPGFFT